LITEGLVLCHEEEVILIATQPFWSEPPGLGPCESNALLT
jgi:hypothetical protein